MIFTISLIGNWERFTFSSHFNLAVFMFLFMVCAFEVVLLKLTTSTASIFERDDAVLDDPSEYEEDIYYEDLRNNYEQWARRRMRYRQREEQMLQEFRMEQEPQPTAYQ